MTLWKGDETALTHQIKTWCRELGFQQAGITDLDIAPAANRLQQWLDKQYHGTMNYMAKHDARFDPTKLLPEGQRAIVVRLDYLPPKPQFERVYHQPLVANISRYAQHRDYHKLIRKRLAKLAERINAHVGVEVVSRATTDSAPIMEKPLAEKAGLGWQGKHTNLINSKAGSWFFLGVLLVNLPLPIDTPHTQSHCGSCQACIDVCPTRAIVAPYQLDARRCISYLTIELKDSIPVEFRPMLGNRIYGCDDCQVVCPWNKFAKPADEKAFHSLRGLAAPQLIDLLAWDAMTFLKNTEGSAIRRIGHERWLRNIAVALGNPPATDAVIAALKSRQQHPSALVREHVEWALQQHRDAPVSR